MSKTENAFLSLKNRLEEHLRNARRIKKSATDFCIAIVFLATCFSNAFS